MSSRAEESTRKVCNSAKKTYAQRIAVLGWGSLLWDRPELVIGGDWRQDGPRLPIEFARVSKHGRLTLVIVPGRKLVKTGWAVSGFHTIKSAVENLATREGTSTGNIGRLVVDGHYQGRYPQYRARLLRWLRSVGCDAVIWTDLDMNFERKVGWPFSIANAARYLKTLTGEAAKTAEEYVRRAPGQTETPLRARVRKDLGWTNL